MSEGAAATKYCVVLTTTASESEAAALARTIVSSRLAACVQVQPIHSYYFWDGKLCEEPEYQLWIKARSAQYLELEELIRQNHSYATPEILRLPVVGGSSDYLAWLDETTRAPQGGAREAP